MSDIRLADATFGRGRRFPGMHSFGAAIVAAALVVPSAAGAASLPLTIPAPAKGFPTVLADPGSDRVAIAWTSSPQGRPSSVKAVLHNQGQGFGAPLTINDGASLRAAVSGQAIFTAFSIQQTPDEDPYAGPLVMQSVSGSGISAPTAVDPTGATTVLATTDPTDHILLARRRFRDNSLHLTGYGGQ